MGRREQKSGPASGHSLTRRHTHTNPGTDGLPVPIMTIMGSQMFSAIRLRVGCPGEPLFSPTSALSAVALSSLANCWLHLDKAIWRACLPYGGGGSLPSECYGGAEVAPVRRGGWAVSNRPSNRTLAAGRSLLSYLHIGRKQERLYIKCTSYLHKLNIKRGAKCN